MRGQRTVARVNDFIPTPVHIEGIANIMRKARELFLQEEHREPSQNEWYERSVRLAGEKYSVSTLKLVTPETFKATQRARFGGRARQGRNVSRGNFDKDTLSPRMGFIEDTLVDEDEDTAGRAIKNITREAIEEHLPKALGLLTSRERTVLEMRYGIGLNEDGKPIEPQSQEQVARIFNLTQTRIGQIEAKALRKLRHPSRSKDLKKIFLHEPDDADKRVGETKKRESTYRDILKTLSNILLKKFNREALVSRLTLIRNGNSSGQIDPELLGTFFIPEEWLELLKVQEKNFSLSPRIFTKDILTSVNYNIGLMKKGYEYKDNLNATWYWQKQPLIRMEEVIDKSKELRKIT